MKITLVNTSDSKGGAAIACYRLFQSLKSTNEEVKLLVQQKTKEDKDIITTSNNFISKYLNFFRFAYERLIFSFYEKDKSVRFAFSMANTGEDITHQPCIKEADVIHLHWIHFGFLSLESLEQLFGLGKPIVWTMHDMWAFTGGCHYAGRCENFTERCKNCSFLKEPSSKDISFDLFKKKLKLFHNANLTFVACSNWLATVAKQSRLLQKYKIKVIPNPIDIQIFKPLIQSECREKFNLPQDKLLILFGAANIFDKRKGLDYLIQALHLLKDEYPQIEEKVELVVFGKAKIDVSNQIPFQMHQLSYLSDYQEIAEAYNCADLFVLPSLQDNLPNTIVESLACGVPAVAFNIGGIPELISHKNNGYLAVYQSAVDLAKGIHYLLFEADKNLLKANAQQKVLENYSENIVNQQYMELYESLLAK